VSIIFDDLKPFIGKLKSGGFESMKSSMLDIKSKKLICAL